jgi:3-dehydroquinate dehydratase
MKEINEQWINEEEMTEDEREVMGLLNESMRDFDYGYGTTGPLHIKMVNRNIAAKKIAAHYNSLKAENERLRERVKELEELASENAKIAVASASYFYGLLSEGEEDERSVANPPNSSTGPDKQSPQ